MAISREKKEQIVAGYVDSLNKSQAVVFTDYRGLTVAQLTDLRAKLRPEGGAYQIVKNSLFRLALTKAGLPIPEEQLEGPVAVGYCFEEVPPVAKIIADFADKADNMELHGALLGSDLLGVADVKDLASLPPREVLLAELVGAVQGPMSSLVTTISAPMRELAQVLKARSEQGQEAAA